MRENPASHQPKKLSTLHKIIGESRNQVHRSQRMR